MSVVLTILLVLGWILGGLLLLILLVPWHLRGQGTVQGEHLAGSAELRWAWGFLALRADPEDAVTIRFLGMRVHRLSPGGRKPDKEDGEPEATSPAGGKARGRAAMEHSATLARLLRVFLRALGLRLRVAGSLGLDSPDRTARAFGMVRWLQIVAPGLDLDLEPEWIDGISNLDGELRARLWPIHLLGVAVGQLLRRDTRRLIAALR